MALHRITFSLVLFFLCLNITGHTQITPALEERLDHLLQDLFSPDGPGGVALVSKENQVVYTKAFGKANLELDVPMEVDHIFRIGSISKQFTACAILRLAEQGKLSLSDDITQYIDDYPTHGHTITIEQLLTHTSGIKSYTGLGKWTAEERKRDFTPKEMIDYFKNEPMDFAPGEDFRYNNSAYFILGYIIEKLSGKTYAAYLQDEFFDPLELTNTSYGSTRRIIKNRAAGYQKEGDEYQNADFLSMSQPYAAGSLLSTVEDINTWYQSVFDDMVLTSDTRKNAHTPFKLNNGQPVEYGHGWFISNIQGSPVIQHGGGINGYLTASLMLPEEDIFVAVFSNCNCNAPGTTAFKMAAELIGKPYEWTPIEMSPQALAEYSGIYASEEGEERTISLEGDNIYSMRSGGARYQIIPFAKDEFYFENSLSTLEFHRNEAGEIESVTSHSTGFPVHWKLTDKAVVQRVEIEVSKEDLPKYVGKYQLNPRLIIQVYIEDDQLYAKATGQETVRLRGYEENKFFISEEDVLIIFNEQENGVVDDLTLIQNGEYSAPRIE